MSPKTQKEPPSCCAKIFCCFCLYCVNKNERDEDSSTDPDEKEKGKEDPYDRKKKVDLGKTVNVKGKRKTLEYNKNLVRVKVNRRPSDIPCLFIFPMFLIFLGAIGGYAFWYGDPQRLYSPTDFAGRVCGRDNRQARIGSILLPNNKDCITFGKDATNLIARQACEEAVISAGFKEDLTEKKYLWYMHLSQLTIYGGVCVSYCPGSGSADRTFCPSPLNSTRYLQNALLPDLRYCSYLRPDLNTTTLPYSSELRLIESTLKYNSLLNRCIPGFGINITGVPGSEQVTSILNEGGTIFSEVLGDTYKGSIVILISAFIAVIVGFIFISLLRICSGLVVWCSLSFLFVVLMALGGLSIYEGYTSRISNEALGLDTTFADIYFYGGIVLCSMGVIYALLILLLFIKIRKAIGIIEEASKAIGFMPHVLFFPVFIFGIIVVFSGYWVTSMLFLWSSGEPAIERLTVRYKLTILAQVLFYVNIFGYFWITQFLIALIYMVVAGAIAQWYWTRKKKLFNLKAFPLMKSLKRTLLYHLGSVAFGSLLVAIIQFLRVMWEKAYNELKKAQGDNKILQGLGWLVRITLTVFEFIIRFINKHAYIQIALYGRNFLYSANNAFQLITRNIVLIGVLHTITTVLMFFGCVTIGVISSLASYGLAKWGYFTLGSTPIYSPFMVSLVSFVISFFVGALFVTIMDTTIDTILQCFLIDDEMCYGTSRQPYCTSSLRKFITEKRAVQNAEKYICQCCCCLTACNGCKGKGEGGGAQPGGNWE